MRTPALEAAFRATTYRVEIPGRSFRLRISQLDPAFDAFLRGRGVSEWCVVTACNPGGLRRDNENPRRAARLAHRIAERGWLGFPACNVADDGDWPDEPGFLLLQVGEAEARRLAAEFRQSACVCGQTGSAPRLVWTRRTRNRPASSPDGS